MAKEAAIELFRENMSDVGQISPASLFLDNSVSLSDPALGSNPEIINDYSKIQAARASAQAQENHEGVLSGSIEGVRGGIAQRVADNRDSKGAKAARDQQRADETAFFLALMQQGDLDAFVAEQMFSGMSDQEILEIADQIEEETGMSVEEHAQKLLGDEMPERQMDESDADYNQRLLQAIAEELLAEDLSIELRHEGHVLLPFIQANEYLQSVRPVAEHAAQIMKDGGTVEAATEHLDASGVLDGGIRAEFASAAIGENVELENVLREDRDLGSDADLDVDARTSGSESVLDSFGLG